MSGQTMEDRSAAIGEVLSRYWGFEALRPLQAEAIDAGVAGRDSLVVLPTGAGKSLCYQVPPAVAGRMDIVVSPLIALMKDQVDALRQCGYAAAAVHSHLDPVERSEVRRGVMDRSYHLLFITPERLLSDRFIQYLKRNPVTSFAIDEAHCISQWGHDFRPEYRRLAELRDHFPEASLHAFTATATTRVQEDIAEQLRLRDPARVIGTFDRPNLIYRVLPAADTFRQTHEIIKRHAGEAAIVYCITRRDTDELAGHLKGLGIRAAAYHGGMEKEDRTRIQEDFAAERLEVVVATVAFGMGIDRSNVRCIIHAAMPKTVEHYQQETGRAGRDGLEAECVLLYSGRDVPRWEHLIGMSAESAEDPEAVIEAQTALLRHMQGYCRGLECRHRTLSRYFGQQYPHESCGACDVCLGEVQGLPDSTTVARKILSGVGRFERPFGVKYLVEVLRGANTATVRERRHDQLSTHSLMRDADEKTLVQLVYQLVDQGLLARSTGEYPTVSLTDDALPVLRGEREVRLSDPGGTKVRRTAVDEASWEGVDRGLFDHLRELRRELATEQAIPPYMIFDDNTLRELAQVRPGSLDTLVHVRGIGRKKLEQFGQRFVDAIVAYCQGNGLETDAAVGSRPSRTVERERRPNPVREQAMKLFADGRTVHEVAEAIGRARSTTAGYLSEYVEQHRPESIDPWVDADAAERVRAAAREHGHAMLRPIYEALDGAIDYETIRLTLAHARARDA